jgi:hypothetical protein
MAEGGVRGGGEETSVIERCVPVFIINNQLPAFEQKVFTTAEICTAAEKVCGYNSIEGAQRIGSLWRIYPRSREHRQKLLLQGLVLRGVSVTVKSRNPFLVREPGVNDRVGDRESNQPPTTKLIISNIPLSYSDTDILQAVNTLGVNVMSKMISERDRDEKGKLTHWKTGRRFVYISIPSTPLPKTLNIGPFKAALYHKEQRTVDRQQAAECRRCLERGHRAAECQAPIKCRQCLKDGHKAGDPSCLLTPDTSQTQRAEHIVMSHTSDDTPQGSQDKQNAQSDKSELNAASNAKDLKDKENQRGRPRHRALSVGQTTLVQFRRAGSGSLKRKKQNEVEPSGTAQQHEKQRRVDNGSNDDDDSRQDSEMG